jgi:hypothetical protein
LDYASSVQVSRGGAGRWLRRRPRRQWAALQSGPERITVGGLPGLRFQGATAVHGLLTEVTLVIAFNGTTQYEITCGHTQATAGEVAQACAQVIRTFKVSKAR